MSIDYTGEYNNTYGDINVRINEAPMDVSEIFLTEDEAQRYANGELVSSKGKPYAGQKISIKVSEETNENGETYGIYKVYVIQGDRTITEVGKDFIAGANIDITNNVISAKGYVYNEEKESFAEGRGTIASGRWSHVEGYYTITNNEAEHAEGRYNISNKNNNTYGNQLNTQHSIGIGTSNTNRINAFEVMQNGDAYLIGTGGYDGTNPKGLQGSTALTIQEMLNERPLQGETGVQGVTGATGPTGPTGPKGEDGVGDTYTGGTNININTNNVISAKGYYYNDDVNVLSFREGESSSGNYAIGKYSHAEGYGTDAYGDYSHAEGYFTGATGDYSHAEGYFTSAYGTYSHVEGSACIAVGEASHAEGSNTTASGYASHSEGSGTIANNMNEHAEGQYNKSNKNNDIYGDALNTQHSIGIGYWDSTANEEVRKNAFEVMQNGDAYLIEAGGYDGTNPLGARTLQQIINNMIPIGTVIDWYGDALLPGNVPYGWIPCGYIKVENENGSWADPYITKWQQKYSGLTAVIESYKNGFQPNTKYGLRITNVNGISIPNLSGRFIIGVDPGTDKGILGATGGSVSHSSGAIGVASTHSAIEYSDGYSALPPYMALQKLIKVL